MLVCGRLTTLSRVCFLGRGGGRGQHQLPTWSGLPVAVPRLHLCVSMAKAHLRVTWYTWCRGKRCRICYGCDGLIHHVYNHFAQLMVKRREFTIEDYFWVSTLIPRRSHRRTQMHAKSRHRIVKLLKSFIFEHRETFPYGQVKLNYISSYLEYPYISSISSWLSVLLRHGIG